MLTKKAARVKLNRWSRCERNLPLPGMYQNNTVPLVDVREGAKIWEIA
jgi:hypothetical protein